MVWLLQEVSMNTEDKLMILFVVCIFLSLSYAVLETAMELKKEVIFDRLNKEARDRRIECSTYYNDGTDRWKECMGVGYE